MINGEGRVAQKVVWRIHAGEHGEAHDLFLDENVIALRRDNMGDITGFSDRTQFSAAYDKANPGLSRKQLGNQGGQYYRFCQEMRSGDVVVYPAKSSPEKSVYIGEVRGDCAFRPEIDPEYAYQRLVDWLAVISRDTLSKEEAHVLGTGMTLCQVDACAEVYLAALETSRRPSVEEIAEMIRTQDSTYGAVEGGKKYGIHASFERNPANRAKAIQFHGRSCTVCGFDFDDSYGTELARGYIEVHHVQPLSEKRRSVDPQKDLVPVCSNCHSMLHRRKGKTVPVDELRRIITDSDWQQSIK